MDVRIRGPNDRGRAVDDQFAYRGLKMPPVTVSRRQFLTGTAGLVSTGVLARIIPPTFVGCGGLAHAVPEQAQTVLTVSRAWKPENGRAYGTVEINMAPDFQIGPDTDMWGIVNARDLTLVTSFEKLRIVGDREWNKRFGWLNHALGGVQFPGKPPPVQPWQEALGGMSAQTALGGVMSLNSKLRIKVLEVIGVPGAAIYYLNSPDAYPIIESMFCDRVGWPIYGSFQNWGRASFRNLTSRNHWFMDQAHWGSQTQERAVALRRLESRGIAARGEAVLCEAGWELVNYTHSGDGVGFKAAGTDYTVRGYEGGRSMFNGVVPSNKIDYPDPLKWRHLHVAENITAEDGVIHGSPHVSPLTPLLYVSFPFTEPLKLKRWTFVKGRPGASNYATGANYAVGQNWSAVEYDDCDFIGWPDKQAAINLSPALEHPTWGPLPAASANVLPSCRFYPE